jgi:hypothetical protein
MRRTRLWKVAPAILLLQWLPLCPQVVDCIVAEVNGKAITLTDIRILRDFFTEPEYEKGEPPLGLRQVLEAALDRRVVLDLVREDIEVSQKEADDLLAFWKGKCRPEDWPQKLATYGLQEEALRPYLEEMVRYDKTIVLRFGRGVRVDPAEIERYYEEVYRPSERVEGRQPKARAQALDEIEAKIKNERARQQSATWVRSLRAQAEVRIHSSCLEQARQ